MGDFVYFSRDNTRWPGPARVVGISDHILTLVHDEKTVTSSLNRVRITQPPLEDLLDDDDDNHRGYQNVPHAPLSSVNIPMSFLQPKRPRHISEKFKTGAI